jgi:Secretion system C-terminal sorting domain
MIMKKIGKFVVAFVFCLLAENLVAQQLQWAQQFSGNLPNGASYAQDVVMDINGNAYVVGSFQGTINFGGSSITAGGFRDFFIAKYNTAGVLQFVKKIGAPNGYLFGTGVSLYQDASHNIFLYITGFISSINGALLVVNFNPGDPMNIKNISMADTEGDTFIAKYNISGTCLWANRIANTTSYIYGSGTGPKIVTDNAGNAYSVANSDRVVKYNINGSLLWDKMASVNSGDVNAIAYYYDKIYIGGNSIGNNAQSIAWYNLDGGFLGGTGNTYDVSSIAVDQNTGEICTAGSLQGAGGYYTLAIQKYSVIDNSAPIWSKVFNNNFTGNKMDISFIQDYTHSNDAEVVVAGWFAGTVNFDSNLPLTSSASGTSGDIFVIRLQATDGTGMWVGNNVSNSSGGTSSPIAIASNAWYFYVMGLVESRTINADFEGCGGTAQIVANNASNGYLARYKVVMQKLTLYSLSASNGFLSVTTNQLKGLSIAEWYVDDVLRETTSDAYGSTWDYLAGSCDSDHSFYVIANRVCGTPLITGSGFYIPPCNGGGGGATVTAFPNPASAQLTVQLQPNDRESEKMVTDEFDIKIYNSMQSVVRTGKSVNGKWDGNVEDLPRGLYYLWVTDRNKIHHKSHLQVSN